MKTILVLLLISLFQSTFPTKLVLNTAKTDQLNVSEIADKITAVTLKDIVIKNLGAKKVFLITTRTMVVKLF